MVIHKIYSFHTVSTHNAPLQVLCNLIKINSAVKPITVNEAKRHLKTNF